MEPVSLNMAFEESEVVIPELEKEENLIVAAGQIVRALESKKTLPKSSEKEEEEKRVSATAFQDQLIAIDEIIMRWEDGQSMIWDNGPDEASEYLNAADEVRGLIEKLESLHLSKEDQEYKFLHKAYGILQTAMARLEKEFRSLLIQYRHHFESEYLSFSTNGEDSANENSVASLGDNSFGESFRTDTVSRASQEYVLDLVHPDVILMSVRCIANLMFACNYDHQCSHAYTVARRDALHNCYIVHETEWLSIENILRMEGVTLNSKIKRWIWTVEIFVREYLVRERWLSENIFGEGEPVSLVCFVDASRASILQLLSYGVSLSIGPHKPEKLFRILDMYEFLASLMPDIDALYSDEVGSSVRLECHEVLKRLGNCVRPTFLQFEDVIASDASSTPFVGSGINPLTRYVMNYVTTLTCYGEMLNLLLKDQEEQEAILLSPDMRIGTEEDSKSQGSPARIYSMANHLRSIALILESNLDDKSKLYKEVALQHLFLMNNIQYMAQKVNGSKELRLIYGDKWLREHTRKFLQLAMNYRTSFSSIVSLLKYDYQQLQMPGSYSILKSLLKERLKRFYLAFENLYRIQTAWLIPDVQLREELRISLSLSLVRAYRIFVRMNAHLCDKHIRYNADVLENYLLDFFEGAPKSLQNPHRR